MKLNSFLFLFICLILPAFLPQGHCQENSLKTGAEQLEKYLPLLRDKKVALVVNQTSIVGEKKKHLLDTLRDRGINVKMILSPEHGFRGQAEAGALINNSKDTQTGLPILSLYGKNKKPTPDQLKGIDLIVFDLQDVGTRFYTYISTMHYIMEACAESDIPLLILDRPNPNDYIEGPILDLSLQSFVGMHPIPILHGLTVGELALMINGEQWIIPSCDLTIIPVKGWKHGDNYSLPVPPSPNLPNDTAIRLYPSLCLFEATGVSVGRGTSFPFQVIGYPDKKMGTFSFTPQSIPGFDKNPLQKGKICYGIDFRQDTVIRGLNLQPFIEFMQRYGGGKDFITRPDFFDLLAGDRKLKEQLLSGKSEQEIKASWQSKLKDYRLMRKKYLLYPEKCPKAL